MTVFWSLVAALGAVVFLVGASSSNAQQVWSIYLVNLVFWSGLAVSGPAIAGMMQVTEARWSPSVRRIALTTAGFLPISFVLFLVLYAGQTVLYPWVTTPIPAKAAWLNVPFFWLRTYVLAAILFAVCFAFVRALLRDALPPDDERERAHRNRVAVILLMLWLVTVSLWGFDLLMSLDPVWYSGLLGGYYVVTSMYPGFGLVTFLAIRANARGVTQISPSGIQDMAKLTFAMSVFWMYFFFSQYLVIWYGNIPIETRFFLSRFFNPPWGQIAWAIFIVGWLIPFSYLLKRLTGRPPTRHKVFTVILFMGWIAIFVERILIVFPSIDKNMRFPLGIREILITAGFFALFALSRQRFLAKYQPLLRQPR